MEVWRPSFSWPNGIDGMVPSATSAPSRGSTPRTTSLRVGPDGKGAKCWRIDMEKASIKVGMKQGWSPPARDDIRRSQSGAVVPGRLSRNTPAPQMRAPNWGGIYASMRRISDQFQSGRPKPENNKRDCPPSPHACSCLRWKGRGRDHRSKTEPVRRGPNS